MAQIRRGEPHPEAGADRQAQSEAHKMALGFFYPRFFFLGFFFLGFFLGFFYRFFFSRFFF